MKKISIFILFLILIFLSFFALFVGKYSLEFGDYIKAFSGDNILANVIIAEIRFPRVMAAVLIGAALSISGATYQAMFVNPLVSPSILGVLSGASFGAGLAMILGLNIFYMQILTFIFGIIAVLISVLISLINNHSKILMLVLGGIISGAIFSSLNSVIKYLADPNDVLPNITYFLMGSLSYATKSSVLATMPLMIISTITLILLSKKLNALSLGEDEAKSLGINTTLLKFILISLTTLISSISVLLAGVIGWIGLVIPHICRFIYGSDNGYVIISSAIFGAIFLLFCDLIAKSIHTYEVPIGLITSFFGIPIFILALFKSKVKF
ncbi:iron ABC transporter permease [Campylobacter sp. FMV-PI01]|uniref:Iron ABC transporter permease n=1 Tax=Campylobacter portucalensis TaxID=2608384 RepID=A0A6L5WLI7_9BACT|nr:iron ABC transporter permease [Campylobacter portucalensis]MSN96875.1 iron ABC transporter permease [Campylobacter portucalensis]